MEVCLWNKKDRFSNIEKMIEEMMIKDLLSLCEREISFMTIENGTVVENFSPKKKRKRVLDDRQDG